MQGSSLCLAIMKCGSWQEYQNCGFWLYHFVFLMCSFGCSILFFFCFDFFFFYNFLIFGFFRFFFYFVEMALREKTIMLYFKFKYSIYLVSIFVLWFWSVLNLEHNFCSISPVCGSLFFVGLNESKHLQLGVCCICPLGVC